MNKEQRAPYLVLFADGYGASMCAFCRSGDFVGDCGGTGYYDCQHPIYDKSLRFEEMTIEVAQGGDCWAFRPKVSLDVAYGMLYNFMNGKDVILEDDLLLRPKVKP